MLRRLTCSVALVLAMLLAGCGGPKDDTITGQVFIVTQGRENVKLGLVTVALYPEAVVREHIAAKREKAAPERQALEEQIAAAQRTISDAKGQAKAALRASDGADARHKVAFEKQISAGALTPGWDEGSREADATFRESLSHLDRAIQWERETAKRAKVLAELTAKYERWDSGPYYLDGLPEATARVQSDANGEFALQVPHKGSFALVAQAQRQVFGLTEDYTWMLSVPDEARKGTKVLLSNETLTTEGSPLSLVHTTR